MTMIDSLRDFLESWYTIPAACLLGVMVVAIIIAFIIKKRKKYLKSAEYKGKIGEDYVKGVIKSGVSGKKYLINNLVLQTGDDMSSQIDHVLICKKGIFVIETKNYSGLVYGDENGSHWTQVLSYGKEKHQIYNPLKQNSTHVYWVNKLLGGRHTVNSCVIMVQGNVENITSDHVFTPNGFVKHVNKTRGKKLTGKEMKMAYDILKGMDRSKKISNKTHIQNVNRIKENVEKGLCPRCGLKLVVHNLDGKKFLGCPNYPKCRYTRAIKEGEK